MSAEVPAAPTSLVDRSANGGRMAWVVLAVLLLFSIAAPLNQFKVPPTMPLLMQAFNLPIGQAGLLMSVYAITGLLLAVPAGFIFQRAGYQLTSLLAGSAIVIGTVLGAISPSIGGLLAGRVIEGIGTSFMAVLAPAVIAVWFVANRRGLAMGIWSNWVPLGSTAMLILAPQLAQAGSWRAVWWVGAAYALVAMVLCLLFVKPPARPGPAATDARSVDSAAMGRLLQNGNLWLLSLAFALLCMAFSGGSTFLPTYLNAERSLPLARGSALAGLGSIAAIFGGPLAGILSDRVGSRKIPYMLGFAANAAIMPLVVIVTSNHLIALMLLQGIVTSLIPPNIFSAAVETAGDERLGGLAMGIIMAGQNAGMLAGPLVFGMLVETAGGWPLAYSSLAVICLLGALAGAAARVKGLPRRA